MFCFKLTFMAIVAATLVFLLALYASSEQGQAHELGRYTRRAYEDDADNDDSGDARDNDDDNDDADMPSPRQGKMTTSKRPTGPLRTTSQRPTKPSRLASKIPTRPPPGKPVTHGGPKSTTTIRPKETKASKIPKPQDNEIPWIDEICIISKGKLVKIDGLGQLKGRPICHPGKCHAKSKGQCPYFKNYA